MALLVFCVWLVGRQNQMCHLCVGKNCFPMRWQKNKKYISFNNLHLLCSPSLPTTVTHMASGGLRAAYLSASTEADAGYKASNTHFPRHWLYAMLAVVFYSILFNISLSFSPTFSLSNSFSDIFNEF